MAPALAVPVPDWPPYALNAYSPEGPVIETLSNKYIQLNLGAGGIVVFTDNAGTVHDLNVAGRWVVSTVKGDPRQPGSSELGLIWNPPFGSGSGNAIPANCPFGNIGYFKLNVNNQIYLLGDNGWSAYPEVYTDPPTGFGRTGPFMAGAWSVSDSSGDDIEVVL